MKKLFYFTFDIIYLVSKAANANLTGTADGRLGYDLLLSIDCSATHLSPPPADQGLGWDNRYRNYTRTDPALHFDVKKIDYFINQVVNNPSDSFYVDKSHVLTSGWSNGTAMAVQYALNTSGITAAALYSTPDPYPSHFTPVLILYNQCDVINICVTGTAFINDLHDVYKNNLISENVIIVSFFKTSTT